jgi:hypothetical protein
LDGSGELLELLDIDGDGRPEYRSSDKNYMSLEAFDMNRLVGTWEMSGCTGVTTECSEMEFQTLKKLAERAASGRAG